MKPLAGTYMKPIKTLVLSKHGQQSMLTHVAAVCRANGFKFVTKKEATTAVKVATYKAAEQNTITSSVDVDQTDVDFVENLLQYWDKNVGPEYIASAQILKKLNYFDIKQLPTLALLVCEYLRQLNTALIQFEKEYKASKKVKSFTEGYKEIDKFMAEIKSKASYKPIKIKEF